MMAHQAGPIAASVLLSEGLGEFVSLSTYYKAPSSVVPDEPVTYVVGGVYRDTEFTDGGVASFRIEGDESGVILAPGNSSIFDFGSDDFEITMKIMALETPADNVVFLSKRHQDGTNRSFRCGYSKDFNRLYIELSFNGSSDSRAQFNFPDLFEADAFFDGTWRTLVFRRQAGLVKVIVDGVEGSVTLNAGTAAIANTFVMPVILGAELGLEVIPSMKSAFQGWIDSLIVKRNNLTVYALDGEYPVDWGYNAVGSALLKTPIFETRGDSGHLSPTGLRILGPTGCLMQYAADDGYDMGSEDFSIEAFLEAQGTGAGPIFGPYDDTDGTRGWEFFSQTNQGVSFRFSQDGLATSVVQLTLENTLTPLNQVRHYAVVRKGNTLSGYVNGSRVATGLMSGSLFAACANGMGLSVLARKNGELLANNPSLYAMKGFRITKGVARYQGASFTVPTPESFKVLG